jgi:hypothetical protein
MISDFFKKWSTKSPQDRVEFDDGQAWQDKLEYFVEPQAPTLHLHEFNFVTMTLEKAFRVFYKTIKRHDLLHDFARRYFECNPRCIFGTVRVIHLMVCALVLLSTQKELGQAVFVQDTMSVIYRHIGTVQKATTHRLNAEHLNWLFYNGSFHDDAFMPRDLSALIFGSIAWQSEIKAILKNIYTSIKTKPLDAEVPSMYHTFSDPPATSSAYSSDDDSSDADSIETKLNSVTGLETNLPSRYLKNAPYYKDGLLSCKCVLQDNKVIKQSWKTHYVMVENNHVYLSSTHGTAKEISLQDSIASMLPFGYNRKRPHCFTIKLADGSAYIFETSSSQETKQWISTCNYWAARTTHHGSLDERAQLKMLQAHINTLFSALDKKKRSTALLREMMKYQTYCNSIESSLAFQIKIMSSLVN